MRKSEIPPSNFCQISGDWAELGISNVAEMLVMKCYWMLQNASITAFTVSELSTLNQQGGEVKLLHLNQIRVKILYLNEFLKPSYKTFFFKIADIYFSNGVNIICCWDSLVLKESISSKFSIWKKFTGGFWYKITIFGIANLYTFFMFQTTILYNHPIKLNFNNSRLIKISLLEFFIY